MSENPFAGMWRLVACEAVRNGQRSPIYGENPIGRLYYGADGSMSVHIMRAERMRFKADTKFRASAQEMCEAFKTYEAYFSNYRVDEENGLIHHTVICSLFPNWVGTTQSRYYKFEGNRLILSTAPIGSLPPSEPVVTLIWERM